MHAVMLFNSLDMGERNICQMKEQVFKISLYKFEIHIVTGYTRN